MLTLTDLMNPDAGVTDDELLQQQQQQYAPVAAAAQQQGDYLPATPPQYQQNAQAPALSKETYAVPQAPEIGGGQSYTPPANSPLSDNAAPAAQPDFKTALENTIGQAPNPTQAQYQPAKLNWKQKLGATALALVNPGEAMGYVKDVENKPLTQYEAAAKDYNDRLDQQLRLAQEERAQREEPSNIALKTAQAEFEQRRLAGATKQHVVVDDGQGNPMPAVFDRETGQYSDPTTGAILPAGTKAWERPTQPTAEQDTQRYEKIQQDLKLGKPVSDEDKAFASAYEKNKTLVPQANAPDRLQQRADRSFQYFSTRLDKLYDPLEQRAARLAMLADSASNNDPQSDTLIAPELLSIMAGGQASGLRMNEAEISRIVGGRNVWDGIKAKFNAWQADPSKGFALSPEQRKAIGKLMKEADARISKKLDLIDAAREKLNDTDDPKEQRRIYSDLSRSLAQADLNRAAQLPKNLPDVKTGNKGKPIPDGAEWHDADGNVVAVVRGGKWVEP